MILTPLQKLTKNVGDLSKIVVTKCFEWLPKMKKIAQSGHTARLSKLGVEVKKYFKFNLFSKIMTLPRLTT